ncbi:MAG: sialidase family protein, partial [Longimicrobiales bacterium]
AWSEPRVVAAGTGWFVNWADFPSVVALGGDDLAAHWLKRSAAGTYAYDVMVSRSHDRGTTWSEPVRPHSDGTPTEHGFVSLFPASDGVGVVWLDGRRFVEHEGRPATNEMTVRFTTLGGTAAPPEVVLDQRVCDCCQTAVALTDRGPLIAYRDRTPGEVRDISVTRLVDGAWTEPRTLHDDNWQIDACPVNGPQADAEGDDVVVAWFTAARDTPRVHVAFSADAGETFDAPVRIDGGDPLGRVDALLLDGERALVLWLERTVDGAEVRARIVARDGRAGEPAAVGATLAQRPSGFPRMARYGDGVLLAWTEPGESSRVRAATLDFGAGRP